MLQFTRQATVDPGAILDRHALRAPDEDLEPLFPCMDGFNQFDPVFPFHDLRNVSVHHRFLFRFLHRSTLIVFSASPFREASQALNIVTPETGCTCRISLSLAHHEDRKTTKAAPAEIPDPPAMLLSSGERSPGRVSNPGKTYKKGIFRQKRNY